MALFAGLEIADRSNKSQRSGTDTLRRVSPSPRETGSRGLCGEARLLFPHERLKGLRRVAAELPDRVGRLEHARLAAQRPPQLRQMFDRVRIEAACHCAVVPELIRNLLVAHV